MKDKNEEDISGLLLWGATVLYITVLCMAFAGLVALDGHGRSVVIIFTEFVKDYGSLLAGIPVLIAVLVAKQQLDANRRQHVATVKRSLRTELDALKAVKIFANSYAGYEAQLALRYHGTPFVGHSYVQSGYPKPDQQLWEDVLNCRSMAVTQTAFDLLFTLNGDEPYKFLTKCDLTLSGEAALKFENGRLVWCAHRLIEELDNRYKHLSQYWS